MFVYMSMYLSFVRSALIQLGFSHFWFYQHIYSLFGSDVFSVFVSLSLSFFFVSDGAVDNDRQHVPLQKSLTPL